MIHTPNLYFPLEAPLKCWKSILTLLEVFELESEFLAGKKDRASTIFVLQANGALGLARWIDRIQAFAWAWNRERR
jgi:hypothetical protein